MSFEETVYCVNYFCLMLHGWSYVTSWLVIVKNCKEQIKVGELNQLKKKASYISRSIIGFGTRDVL